MQMCPEITLSEIWELTCTNFQILVDLTVDTEWPNINRDF